MQVVHDEIADFNHIVVKLIVITQELIALQLTPRDFKQLLKELSETRKVNIVLLEKLVANCSSSQLHDKVIDCLDTVLNLLCVVARHFMRLHFFTIGLRKSRFTFLVLFFRDKILSKFILRVQIKLLAIHFH